MPFILSLWSSLWLSSTLLKCLLDYFFLVLFISTMAFQSIHSIFRSNVEVILTVERVFIWKIAWHSYDVVYQWVMSKEISLNCWELLWKKKKTNGFIFKINYSAYLRTLFWTIEALKAQFTAYYHQHSSRKQRESFSS